MSISPLSEGGKVALAAKQATSASLGLKSAVCLGIFQAGLWRIYLTHDAYPVANPVTQNAIAEHEEVISETAAIMAPVTPRPDLRHARQHVCNVLSEGITYLAAQQGCRAPMAAVTRSLQHVISVMDDCMYEQISRQFKSVLHALSSLTLFGQCAAHKTDFCGAMAERELFSAASIIMRTEPALQVKSWRQGRTTSNADTILCIRSQHEDSLPLLQLEQMTTLTDP